MSTVEYLGVRVAGPVVIVDLGEGTAAQLDPHQAREVAQALLKASRIAESYLRVEPRPCHHAVIQ